MSIGRSSWRGISSLCVWRRFATDATSVGYETGIQCYDSARRAVVPLVTRRPGVVTWYTCGPTVYDSAHVGHASCYVKLDILRRVLTDFFDLNCVYLLGMTDIDDKIIKRSRERNVSPSELAKKYEDSFMDDMAALFVRRPSGIVRVSEHVENIQRFVQTLMDKKLAYRSSSGSVYFDTRAFESSGFTYGKFVPLNTEECAELEDDVGSADNKKNRKDFALWKAVKPLEPSWDSRFGPGRPGWHIECSAMASQVFGDWVDIHSGGTDLIFPHHENEEAQSCAFHGNHQWVGHWIHTGQLNVKGEKMSKSLKNFTTVGRLLENHSADQFRMMCMMSHYRSKIDYSEETLALAGTVLAKFNRFLKECDEFVSDCGPLRLTPKPVVDNIFSELTVVKEKIVGHLKNDFKTAGVIRCLEDLMKQTQVIFVMGGKMHQEPEAPSSNPVVVVGAVADLFKKTLNGFGFQISNQISSVSSTNEAVTVESLLNSLLKFRMQVREYALVHGDGHNFPKEKRKEMIAERKSLLVSCDDLRKDLADVGILLKDSSNGTKYEIVNTSSTPQKRKSVLES